MLPFPIMYFVNSPIKKKKKICLLTKLSPNSAHGEVHSIKLYMIKLVSELRQVDSFLRLLQFPPCAKKTDRHDIARILFKVALSTVALTMTRQLSKQYSLSTRNWLADVSKYCICYMYFTFF